MAQQGPQNKRGTMVVTLSKKQTLFTLMVAKLINFAYENGYELTFGDAFRSSQVKYGSPNSLHRIRLAVDFNLFKDGKFLSKTEDHKLLGEYWESIGGSWGGRFDVPDGNHYSLEHNGRK